jgi:hypothetical protein
VISHGLAEERARGIPIAGFENKSAKVIQDAEISRPAGQELEIVALRFLKQALFSEQAGAFVTGFERLGILLQRSIELPNTTGP